MAEQTTASPPSRRELFGKAAAGAVLPAAAAHGVVRIVLLRLALVAAVAAPVSGVAVGVQHVVAKRRRAAQVAAERQARQASESANDVEARAWRDDHTQAMERLAATAAVLQNLKKLPIPEPEATFRRAEEELVRGNWQQAVKLYDWVVAMNERSPSSIPMLARLRSADLTLEHSTCTDNAGMKTCERLVREYKELVHRARMAAPGLVDDASRGLDRARAKMQTAASGK